MKNLEGIKNVEINEKNLEKNCLTVNENFVSTGEEDDFEDCAKTIEDEKRELENLKEEILYYDQHCKKQPNSEIEDDFEDCRKR